MAQPPPPPEPKPAFLRLSLKDLQLFISSPATVLVLLVLAAAPGLVSLLKPEPSPPVELAPEPGVVSVRTPVFAALATAALGELPPAIQGQALPPCDPDLERQLRGACWIPVNVQRCPPGKAFLNDRGPDADGKCYARAMKAYLPTSGEPRTLGVADP